MAKRKMIKGQIRSTKHYTETRTQLKTNILSGEERRSSAYALTVNDVAIEDSRLKPGWYRIDSVGQKKTDKRTNKINKTLHRNMNPTKNQE
jgi:hypothetical protein